MNTSNESQVSADFPHPTPPHRVACHLPAPPNETGRDRTEPLTASQILGCSATAKMTASIVTYPHEVVRTRFQTEKRPLNGNGGHDPKTERRGIVRMTQHIVTHEGWRALYRGLSVNLVRTVPNSAVTMFTWVHFYFTFHCARGRRRVLTVTCPRARFPCFLFCFAGTRCSCAPSTVDRAFHDTTSGCSDATIYHVTGHARHRPRRSAVSRGRKEGGREGLP